MSDKTQNKPNPVKSVGHLLQRAGADESKSLTCPEHGAFQSTKLPSGEWSGCPECTLKQAAVESAKQVAVEQEERKKAAEASKLKSLRIKANIPLRFQSRNLDQFEAPSAEQKKCLATCQKYLQHFDDRFEHGGGLVLQGKPGTGKTHLAASIGNALVEQGRSVLFVDVYDLIDGIKDAAFDKKECSELEARNRFTGFDLLILDEVGAQLGSDWEKATLFKVINDRYKAQLPTILISNLAGQAFEQYVGDRVVDRMREGGGATLTFNWESYRSNRFRKGSAA